MREHRCWTCFAIIWVSPDLKRAAIRELVGPAPSWSKEPESTAVSPWLCIIRTARPRCAPELMSAPSISAAAPIWSIRCVRDWSGHQRLSMYCTSPRRSCARGGLLIGGATTNTALAADHRVRTGYPVLSRAIFGGRVRSDPLLDGLADLGMDQRPRVGCRRQEIALDHLGPFAPLLLQIERRLEEVHMQACGCAQAGEPRPSLRPRSGRSRPEGGRPRHSFARQRLGRFSCKRATASPRSSRTDTTARRHRS